MAMFEADPPAVVLLDLSMPGLDGWAFLDRRSLEPTWQRVSVLVMSGSHDRAGDALKRGANGFLPKPFTIEQLRLRLSDLVYGEPGADRP
jgi:CheY-like chemotaxis protein